jgi:hypothetical protein
MGLIDRYIDPKTEAILRIVIKKIVHRFPLSLCMIISTTILTYIFIFYEVLLVGWNVFIILIMTLLLAITTSFAFEYDTKDELMNLINIGVSPSDIFKIGIIRLLSISLIGYFIGIILAIIFPLSEIKNNMLFYSFLISIMLGIFPSLYSSLKSMQISLVGRIAFRPLMENIAPVILSVKELPHVKDYIEERLKEREDLVILNINTKENSIEILCRYLGDTGRLTFVTLSSLGINPDESLKNDETLPIIGARVIVKEGSKTIIDYWEGKERKKSFISQSFQSYIQQLLIEYKVFKSKGRGFEFKSY